MAILARPSPQEPEHFATILSTKYDEVLKRAQRQVTLAREMSINARRMIDCAVEMREGPHHSVVR